MDKKQMLKFIDLIERRIKEESEKQSSHRLNGSDVSPSEQMADFLIREGVNLALSEIYHLKNEIKDGLRLDDHND